MSVPILPPPPQNPPVYPQPPATPPQNPPVVYPPQTPSQGSSIDLAGTQAQSNENNATNVTNIRNSATFINEIKGSRVQVGDISYDVPAIGVSAGVNQYGDYDVRAQLMLPLAGRKVRRSATQIAEIRAKAALGALCKSVRTEGFTVEIVESLYPDMPQLKACAVTTQKIVETAREQIQVRREAMETKYAEQEEEIIRLKAEIEEMKNKKHPVQGLW